MDHASLGGFVQGGGDVPQCLLCFHSIFLERSQIGVLQRFQPRFDALIRAMFAGATAHPAFSRFRIRHKNSTSILTRSQNLTDWPALSMLRFEIVETSNHLFHDRFGSRSNHQPNTTSRAIVPSEVAAITPGFGGGAVEAWPITVITMVTTVTVTSVARRARLSDTA